jgi:hypothetical protein
MIDNKILTYFKADDYFELWNNGKRVCFEKFTHDDYIIVNVHYFAEREMFNVNIRKITNNVDGTRSLMYSDESNFEINKTFALKDIEKIEEYVGTISNMIMELQKWSMEYNNA